MLYCQGIGNPDGRIEKLIIAAFIKSLQDRYATLSKDSSSSTALTTAEVEDKTFSLASTLLFLLLAVDAFPREEFIKSVAADLNVDPSNVEITEVTSSPSGSGRRLLQQSGVVAAYTVGGLKNYSDATTMQQQVQSSSFSTLSSTLGEKPQVTTSAVNLDLQMKVQDENATLISVIDESVRGDSLSFISTLNQNLASSGVTANATGVTVIDRVVYIVAPDNSNGGEDGITIIIAFILLATLALASGYYYFKVYKPKLAEDKSKARAKAKARAAGEVKLAEMKIKDKTHLDDMKQKFPYMPEGELIAFLEKANPEMFFSASSMKRKDDFEFKDMQAKFPGMSDEKIKAFLEKAKAAETAAILAGDFVDDEVDSDGDDKKKPGFLGRIFGGGNDGADQEPTNRA